MNMRRRTVQKTIAVSVLIVISLLGYFFASDVFEKADAQGPAEPAKAAEAVDVYVTGAVNNPGVHVIVKRGQTINDAIVLAGGLSDEADISAVDLSESIEKNTTLDVPYR